MGFTGAPGSRPAPLSSMSTGPRAVTSGCGRPALTYVHVCRFTRVASGEIRGVSDPAAREPCPVAELIALARGHAVFCRRDIARVAMALRVEFSGKDEPVGRELERVTETAIKRIARLIQAGRRDGSIPPGPPARTVALAVFGALEGTVIALSGQAPHDKLPAERAVRGVLGLDPTAAA
jgi:hypothetical protein